MEDEDINGRSFLELSTPLLPNLPKGPIIAPAHSSVSSRTSLFPGEDQLSLAQPSFPLTHSSSCCCPSRPAGTYGNFSPRSTLPPSLGLSWGRTCVTTLGPTSDRSFTYFWYFKMSTRCGIFSHPKTIQAN